MGKSRKRLDELLVERGLVENRSRAKALIMAGKVRSGTEILDKAGKEYPPEIELEVAAPQRFVSRGAEKLEGFFKAYPWDVEGKPFLDIGASTGGFTDYLLQSGATEATCVDVGHGQLHYKLRQDERVKNLERVNARHLKADQLPHSTYPLVVMDLSFISLKLVVPAVLKFLQPDADILALIKPQFEVGRDQVGKGGVVRDQALHRRVIETLTGRFSRLGLHADAPVTSSIRGPKGNVEYFILLNYPSKHR